MLSDHDLLAAAEFAEQVQLPNDPTPHERLLHGAVRLHIGQLVQEVLRLRKALYPKAALTNDQPAAKPYSVKNCLRCGGEHAAIDIRPYQNPPSGWTHYALCPSTGEPLHFDFDRSGAVQPPRIEQHEVYREGEAVPVSVSSPQVQADPSQDGLDREENTVPAASQDTDAPATETETFPLTGIPPRVIPPLDPENL